MSESGFAIRGNRHLIYTLFAKKKSPLDSAIS
jgi:hypothetical protein